MPTYPDHGDSSRSEAQEIPETVRSLLLKIGDLEELKVQLRDANQRITDVGGIPGGEDTPKT